MLKKHHIRTTPFRLLILSLFKRSNNALSIKDIECALGDFDRVTLYRTLKLFTEKGVIHEVLHLNGKRYALCQEKCNEYRHSHDHLHFHCSKCEESICVESEMPSLNLAGYLVENIDLNFYGVCKNCNT